MSKRYEIELSPAWEVGIHCLYVWVRTKTRAWGNGPIITAAEDFCVLTPEAKRSVKALARRYEDIEDLLLAAEEGEVTEVEPIQVRLVMADCKTNRRYLYVSDLEEFLSEADVIAYAKEGEE